MSVEEQYAIKLDKLLSLYRERQELFNDEDFSMLHVSSRYYAGVLVKHHIDSFSSLLNYNGGELVSIFGNHSISAIKSFYKQLNKYYKRKICKVDGENWEDTLSKELEALKKCDAKLLDAPINFDYFDSVRVRNAFFDNMIYTYRDLSDKRADTIKGLHGIGKKSIVQLINYLPKLIESGSGIVEHPKVTYKLDNKYFEELSRQDPGFLAQTIPFNKDYPRLFHIFKMCGIKTYGDIVRVGPTKIYAQEGCGYKTKRNLDDLIERAILYSPIGIDASNTSYDIFIKKYKALSIQNNHINNNKGYYQSLRIRMLETLKEIVEVASLSKRDAEVFVKRNCSIQPETYRAIAKDMGISPTTVNKIDLRCKNKIKSIAIDRNCVLMYLSVYNFYSILASVPNLELTNFVDFLIKENGIEGSIVKKVLTKERIVKKEVKETKQQVVVPPQHNEKDSKIKTVHINAVKGVSSSLKKLVDVGDTTFLDKPLKETGMSNYSLKDAIKAGYTSLNDIYIDIEKDANNIIKKYKYVQKRLKHLKTNVKKVVDNELKSFKKTIRPIIADNVVETIMRFPSKAKKYNEQHLLGMADWNEPKITESKGTIRMPDGYYYEYDSDIEKRIVSKLLACGLFKKLRGQNYIVSYSKRKREKDYHPDIVFLDNNDHICFIEAKPLYNMPTEANTRKIKALAKLCKENGYGYCMCDDKFNPIEYLAEIAIKDDIKKLVIDSLWANRTIRYPQYKQIEDKAKKKGYSETTIKTQIAAIVYKYNLYFKGDFTNNVYKIIISTNTKSTLI